MEGSPWRINGVYKYELGSGGKDKNEKENRERVKMRKGVEEG